MNVFIATDLEGVSGVVDFLQTGRDERGADYAQACHLLTADVNAAVSGALDAGADEVVVMDGHGGGRNFVYSELRAGARYVTGAGRLNFYPGFSDRFDALLLVGFHAMAGTPLAILDHTMISRSWLNFSLNGIRLGEIGFNAAVAGRFGVPVVFVSGDAAACEEATALLGDIETVAVKRGLSRTCAELLAPDDAHALLQAGVKRALERCGDVSPYRLDPPIHARLELQNTDDADHMQRTGWQRVDGRTVEKTVDDIMHLL